MKGASGNLLDSLVTREKSQGSGVIVKANSNGWALVVAGASFVVFLSLSM